MEPLPYVYLFAPACTLILALIWREARRAGYAPDRVAAAMAACAAGAVIGSKVLMFDFHAAEYGEKTFLGAVVGGVVSLAIVLKALQFDARAYDVPVLPVIWGHALGRVGCFISGCCHGIETAAPWGIQYSFLPAPVHPTQLYESLLDVALALLLTRHRARFDRPASFALTGAVGIAMVRFLVEPWRAEAVPGPLGLTLVQTTTLAVMVAAIATLAVRERFTAKAAAAHAPPSWERSGWVLVGVLILALTTRAWLTPLEALLVGAVVSVSGLVVLRRALPRVAMASPVVGLAVVAPMQTRDSLPPTPTVRPAFETVSWHSLATSVAAGTFEVTTEDCDGNTVTTQDHTFKVLGVAAETYTQERPGVGAGGRFTSFAGLNTAPRATRAQPLPAGQPAPGADAARHDEYLGATFSGTIDRKWVGATFGVAAGKFLFRPDYPRDVPTVPTRAFPIGALRIGKLTGVHFATDVGMHTPSFAPGPLVRIGLGIGDSTAWNLFRFGFEEGGPFVTGRVVSKGGLEFEPYVSFGNRFMVSAGIKKRFYRTP